MVKNAKYIKNTLGKGEEIKWVANLHWFVWVIPTLCLLFGILTLIAGVGLFFIFIFVYLWLSWLKTEYVVTNKRVVAKRGIIAVNTEELRIPKVESIYIKQGIFGRIFGCGNVVFCGTGGSTVLFKYIGDPRQVKTRLEEIIDDNK